MQILCCIIVMDLLKELWNRPSTFSEHTEPLFAPLPFFSSLLPHFQLHSISESQKTLSWPSIWCLDQVCMFKSKIIVANLFEEKEQFVWMSTAATRGNRIKAISLNLLLRHCSSPLVPFKFEKANNVAWVSGVCDVWAVIIWF